MIPTANAAPLLATALTVLIVAVVGAPPAVVSAAGSGGPAKVGGSCPEWMCGSNHNEVLATSQER